MTYEYLCTACNHEWEASQPISEAPLTQCPACKKNTAKRQISGGTGFLLKGGGWYADLYGSAKPAAKKESTSESATSTTPSESGSSAAESPKPAAEKPAKETKPSKPAAKSTE